MRKLSGHNYNHASAKMIYKRSRHFLRVCHFKHVQSHVHSPFFGLSSCVGGIAAQSARHG
jgi:hypothetical protein